MENLIKILSNEPDLIIKILEETGFFNITLHKNEGNIRCALRENGNPTSVSINCETLQAYVFSRGVGGILPKLIAQKYNWSTNYTIKYLQRIIGIDEKSYSNCMPFNGALKIKRIHTVKENKAKFDIHELDKLPRICNQRFLNDNISLKTQQVFDLRYSFQTNRIIIPWRDKNGEYLGYSARLNFDDIQNESKYKSSIGLKKSDNIYGLYENKDFFKNYDSIILCEAEKSVLQAYSFGYNNVLALGGSHISEKQARTIKTLPIQKVIIALDEGLSVELLLKEAEKLKGGIFNNIKEIYVLYDNGEVLGKGTKNSPTDLGKEKFETLLKKYCYRKD